jgi:hypothetical protein
MPENEFEFLKQEFAALRLDVLSIQGQVQSIHNHLKFCQTRCHVPGPSLVDAGKHLISRIIERIL